MKGHILRVHASSVVAMDLLDQILSYVTDGHLTIDHENMVGSMLEDIITTVMSKVVEDGQEIIEEEEEDDDGISSFLKARDARVAEIQAEFEHQFPSFRKEVRDLRVVKKVKRKSKTVGFETPARKSSRIRGHLSVVDQEPQSADSEWVQAGVQNSGDVNEIIADKEANETEMNGMEALCVGFTEIACHLETGAGDMGDMSDASVGDVEVSTGAIRANILGAGMEVVVVETSTNVEVETGTTVETGAPLEAGTTVEAGTSGEAATTLEAATTVDAGTSSVGSSSDSSLGKFACIPCEKPFR